jgi:hypothetical protein
MSDKQKIYTYGQLAEEARQEVDLDEEDPDEEFVKFDELVGHFNDAIDAAEAKIISLNEDYFLAYDFVPLEEDEDEYDMPRNIYADKIRAIIFSDGSRRYPVKRFRNRDKFEHIANAQESNTSDDYRYFLLNNSPGGRKMVIVPAARETAVLPPLSNPSTPMKRWYIRNANRVPILGEYTNDEDVLASSVNAGTDVITVDPTYPYVTGDSVKLSVVGSNVVPGGLAANTVYYVIRQSDTAIKLATTLALARAGTAIDITSQGTGYFTIQVAATRAIINATVIDIPEFASFLKEWVKANCLLKDGDPRASAINLKLEKAEKLMVDTLTDREPDNDNEIEADFSHYYEMS